MAGPEEAPAEGAPTPQHLRGAVLAHAHHFEEELMDQAERDEDLLAPRLGPWLETVVLLVSKLGLLVDSTSRSWPPLWATPVRVFAVPRPPSSTWQRVAVILAVQPLCVLWYLVTYGRFIINADLQQGGEEKVMFARLCRRLARCVDGGGRWFRKRQRRRARGAATLALVTALAVVTFFRRPELSVLATAALVLSVACVAADEARLRAYAWFKACYSPTVATRLYWFWATCGEMRLALIAWSAAYVYGVGAIFDILANPRTVVAGALLVPWFIVAPVVVTGLLAHEMHNKRRLRISKADLEKARRLLLAERAKTQKANASTEAKAGEFKAADPLFVPPNKEEEDALMIEEVDDEARRRQRGKDRRGGPKGKSKKGGGFSFARCLVVKKLIGRRRKGAKVAPEGTDGEAPRGKKKKKPKYSRAESAAAFEAKLEALHAMDPLKAGSPAIKDLAQSYFVAELHPACFFWRAVVMVESAVLVAAVRFGGTAAMKLALSAGILWAHLAAVHVVSPMLSPIEAFDEFAARLSLAATAVVGVLAHRGQLSPSAATLTLFILSGVTLCILVSAIEPRAQFEAVKDHWAVFKRLKFFRDLGTRPFPDDDETLVAKLSQLDAADRRLVDAKLATRLVEERWPALKQAGWRLDELPPQAILGVPPNATPDLRAELAAIDTIDLEEVRVERAISTPLLVELNNRRNSSSSEPTEPPASAPAPAPAPAASSSTAHSSSVDTHAKKKEKEKKKSRSLGTKRGGLTLFLTEESVRGAFDPQTTEVIDLSGCKLASRGDAGDVRGLTLPGVVEAVGCLPALATLDLGGNCLEGTFPSAGVLKAHLPALLTLDISGVCLEAAASLRAVLETVAAALPKLRDLNLSANSLTGDFPSDLFELRPQLRDLRSFEIAENRDLGFEQQQQQEGQGGEKGIVGIGGFEKVARCFNPATLEVLELSSCVHLGGSLFEALGTLTALRSFGASNCGLTGPLPRTLPPVLEKFSVGAEKPRDEVLGNSNVFTDPVPHGWALHPALAVLEIAGCNLAGPLPPSLPPNLQRLVLGGKQHLKTTANAFPTLPPTWADGPTDHIRILLLCNCGLRSATDIIHVISHLPNLTQVDLRSNDFDLSRRRLKAKLHAALDGKCFVKV